MKQTDNINKLRENLFQFYITKSQKILIHYENRLIKTLSEKESQKFISRMDGKNDFEVQLELAKLTGNFKHGNEKK